MGKEEELIPSAPPPCYEDAIGGGGFPGAYMTNHLQTSAPVVPIYPQQPGYPQQSGYYPGPTGPPPGTAPPMPTHQPPFPVINTVFPVGPKPLRCQCPHCQASIKTRLVTYNKYAPHICCFLLLLTVVCSCFSCLPYCLCPAERTEHFCPKCNAFLGSYTKQ